MATKHHYPGRRKPAQKEPDALDPDHQAALILASFSEYLEKNPDRSIVLSRPDHGRGGWRVELHDQRVAHGNTLRDATAQVATVLVMDSAE